MFDLLLVEVRGGGHGGARAGRPGQAGGVVHHGVGHVVVWVSALLVLPGPRLPARRHREPAGTRGEV